MVFLTLAMLSGACGARLTTEQRDVAINGTGRGGTTNTGNGTGTTDPGGTPIAGGPTTGPGPGATAGPGGTPVTGPSGSTGPGGGGQPVACAPGDKGNTDVGVTKDSITLANIADISGPVPGLFESAQQATKAFVAYWNATYGGVCGRQLKLKTYDSGTASNAHRNATLEACDQTFASVGSISAFDDGGAGEGQSCGIADFSAAAVTKAHQAATNTYAASGTKAGVLSSTLPKYISETFPEAVSKAAYIYLNAGASAENAQANIKTYEKYGHGWKFIYVQPVDVATFNYAPFVQQMKSKGVRFVQWLGSAEHGVKLAQTMKEQNFTADMFLLDPIGGYSQAFTDGAGDAAEKAYVYIDSALFEEGGNNAELQLYLTWLKRVAGNAKPGYFGLFAWSAARLFVTLAAKVGPDLTRKAILAEARKVDDWTGNGVSSAQNVGEKTTSNCFAFIQRQSGAWKRVFPSSGWACNPLISG